MAESTEHKESDLNTFKEDMDSKNVEKEAINLEKAESVNSNAASIAFDIDEDIAQIQAESIIAVANSIKSNVGLGTGEIKQSNLEIEAALNNTIGISSGEGASSSAGDRNSTTQCQLAAYFAENTAKDARLVIAMGEDLIEVMASTVAVLKSHIEAFAEKSMEASERGTERGYSVADFYNSMVSKYEAAVAALENRAQNVEIALDRLQEAADECLKYAGLAEEVIDETLEGSTQVKFSACWWTNKGKAAIIVALKKERAALLMMRRMWLSVQDDKEYEDLNRTAEDTDEETQQCEHRDRKTKIGHIVATLLGLALLSVTSLFKVGSDSFNAILALGLLTTGWCAVYWSVKLYKCLKESDNERTIVQTERAEEDSFLENCNRRLAIIIAHLRKYNIVMDSETESDTGSAETVRVDDTSR